MNVYEVTVTHPAVQPFTGEVACCTPQQARGRILRGMLRHLSWQHQWTQEQARAFVSDAQVTVTHVATTPTIREMLAAQGAKPLKPLG